MMIKYLEYLVLFLLMFTSCQKINDYYSDINNSSLEKIKIGKIKSLDLACSAIKQDKYLNIILDVKILDSVMTIDDITILVNGLENPILEKKEFFKQNGKRFVFNEFGEVSNYFNGLTGIIIPIYFSFEDPRVLKIDDLNFTILIKSNSRVFTKKIAMKKHSRYRFFLEGG